MERDNAFEVLTDHQPVKRWFGWRLTCSRCGDQYPCSERVRALDELAGRAPRSWL
jgi:hypothetical protein